MSHFMNRNFPTVPEIARAHARKQPQARAIAFEGRVTTYAQFDNLADRIAAKLASGGAVKGSRIIYLGRNCDSFYPLWFGAMRCGAVLVPINWRLAAPEAAVIAADSEGEILFVGPGIDARVVSTIVAAMPRPIQLVALETELESWCDIDPVRSDFDAAHPDDVAIQLYTSGTTGVPKGVQLSHRALLEPLETRLEAGIEWEHIGAGQAAIVDLPLFHLGGTAWPLVALHGGAELLVAREFSAAFILSALATHDVPILLMVPATMRLLLDASSHPDQFARLKVIRYGGSPITEDLLRACIARFGCSFVQTFGSTETGGIVTALPAVDHVLPATARMRSAGRALPGVELAIMGGDGAAQTAGAPGEIIVRSASNMTGYWKRPDASADAWLADAWLRTGDAGYLDEDGYLFILDRTRDLIITGGENVYPAEVENALADYPGIEEAAVIGLPDEQWGEVVAAFIVAKGEQILDAPAIIAHCRDRIAGYKCPKVVTMIEALPRNALGKVMKSELRAGRQAASLVVAGNTLS